MTDFCNMQNISPLKVGPGDMPPLSYTHYAPNFFGVVTTNDRLGVADSDPPLLVKQRIGAQLRCFARKESAAPESKNDFSQEHERQVFPPCHNRIMPQTFFG